MRLMARSHGYWLGLCVLLSVNCSWFVGTQSASTSANPAPEVFVDLSYQNLTQVPPKATETLDATHLQLNNNQLTQAADVSALKVLKQINLQHNQLRDLSALSAASSVRVLLLRGNPLRSLLGAERLLGLQRLEAAYCQIESFAQIPQSASLESLEVEHNPIKSMAELGHYPALKKLSMSLSEAPRIQNLENLPSLESLQFDAISSKRMSRASYDHLKRRGVKIGTANSDVDLFISNYGITLSDD